MVCLIDQLLIDTNTFTTKSRTSEQSNIKYVTGGFTSTTVSTQVQWTLVLISKDSQMVE